MDQQIRKILYKSNYKINETPKYKLVELINGEEQDKIPQLNNNPIVKEEGEEEIVAPETDTPQPEPKVEQPPQEVVEPVEEPIVAPQPIQQTADDIQNEIIRMNIETMKIIHARVEELNNEVESLKNKSIESEAKIEAMKPKTDGEKMIDKKYDSHPYQYNLNDLWDGNYFQARRDEFGEKGIKRLEDGSYIADFDDLPTYTSTSIKNTY